MTSQMSAMVPAPIAWTEEAALWLSTRIAISIPIEFETAARMLQMTKSVNETT